MNRHTVSTIALALALTPFVGFISTTNAVNGLASAPALQMNMVDTAVAWQDYAAQQVFEAASARSVMDAIEPLKVSLCTTAGLEERNGVLSGSPGRGAVSSAYVSSCSGTTAISNTLLEAVKRNEARQALVSAAIEHLLEIPEQDNVSIFERQDEFTNAVAPLKKTVADAQSENLRDTVKAQLAIATNAVASLETANTDFGELQRAAVIALKAQLADVERIVSAFLDDGVPQGTLEQPEALLPSGEAILRYWPRLTAQILAAVGVDLAILWLAAFLSVSRTNLRRMEASSPLTPPSSGTATATA